MESKMKEVIRKFIEVNRDVSIQTIDSPGHPLHKKVIHPEFRCPFERQCYLCSYLLSELMDMKEEAFKIFESEKGILTFQNKKCPCNTIGRYEVVKFVEDYLELEDKSFFLKSEEFKARGGNMDEFWKIPKESSFDKDNETENKVEKETKQLIDPFAILNISMDKLSDYSWSVIRKFIIENDYSRYFKGILPEIEFGESWVDEKTNFYRILIFHKDFSYHYKEYVESYYIIDLHNQDGCCYELIDKNILLKVKKGEN